MSSKLPKLLILGFGIVTLFLKQERSEFVSSSNSVLNAGGFLVSTQRYSNGPRISRQASLNATFGGEKVGICDDFCVLNARSKLYGGGLMC